MGKKYDESGVILLKIREKRKKMSRKKHFNNNNVYQKVLQKFNLSTRLFLLFVSLLVLSVVVVGVSSYIKAKDMNMETIENRLVRETDLMGYIAANLKFVYVSDDDYFMQQLDTSVRTQKEKLKSDGITSEFFYIVDKKVTPFKVSEKSLPTISNQVINQITNKKTGVFHEKIKGEDYTITFQANERNWWNLWFNHPNKILYESG